MEQIGTRRRARVSAADVARARGMTVEERASVLKFRPEMATFNAGSFNFGLYPVASRDLPFAD